MYLERSRERCHLQAVTRALACQCFVGVRWVADAADQASSTASIASMAMHAALARLRDWAPALARRQRHGTSMANAPNRTFMLVRFRYSRGNEFATVGPVGSGPVTVGSGPLPFSDCWWPKRCSHRLRVARSVGGCPRGAELTVRLPEARPRPPEPHPHPPCASSAP